MKKILKKKTKVKEQHIPVMLKEVLKSLDLKRGKVIVDATLGLGGHSKEIIRKLSGGELIGMDCDETSIRTAQESFNGKTKGMIFIRENFRNIGKVLRSLEHEKVDGILFDLGISSWQLDHGDRGFSFLKEGPLDMRMSREDHLTAEDIVNSYSVDELKKIFKEYGEEKKAGRIAKSIVRAREKAPILTTTRLAEVISKAAGKVFHRKIHPATQTFQALRIEVNRELESLRLALSQAVDHLKPGGRLVVISFHSLEDRIVKETFNRFAVECVCPPKFPKCVCGHKAILKIITKKPIVPLKTETTTNPRARSAKLRVAEKV